MNSKIYELIFFITSKCNSRCSHCFNWRNVNTIGDMQLSEIDGISRNLPEIENLLLSGGEPFLRDDLPEIIKIFRKNNNIRTLSIPTNGLLGGKIAATAAKLLEIEGLELININFSLDGLPESHDRVRGVPGNFSISVDAMDKLSPLRKKESRLNVLANSVVTGHNQDELLELASEIKKKGLADNHFFEIIRPGKDVRERKPISKDFFDQAIAIQYGYFSRMLRGRNPLKKIVRKVMFLGKLSFMYSLQLKNYADNSPWPMACAGGKDILVLESDGRIKPCEIRPAYFKAEEFADQRKGGQNAFAAELENISREKCFCTHTCFIDASIDSSPYIKYVKIPLSGLMSLIRL